MKRLVVILLLLPGFLQAQVDSTSGGNTTISESEMETTPVKWPPRKVDSLFKHMNIYTKYIGQFDTTGKYVNRDVVMRILNTRDEYRGRDSSFLFLGMGCIQIELRLGSTADEKDSVVWRDICHEDCFDSVTVPLGCYVDSTETKADTHTVVICDTVCTTVMNVQEKLYYLQFSGTGAFNLQLLAGCNKPKPPGGNWLKMVLYNGQWFIPLDTTSYGTPFYPAADSCYISGYQYAYWQSQTETPYSYWSGQGPWWVDSSKTVQRTVEVGCELYGLPGITRTVTNCRDTLRTDTITVTTRHWIDAGRDTTIWDNLCDCLIPVFLCEDRVDSTRHVRYIYEYEYTRDSVQCEEIYQIPIYDVYPLWPVPGYIVCGQPDQVNPDTAFLRLDSLRSLAGTDSRTHPNQRHVRQLPQGDTCWAWSCSTTADVPPLPGLSEFWIDADTLDAWFPCPGAQCVADSIGYTEWLNWCCGKDTTVTFVCMNEDGELEQDTVQVTYHIPDRTQPCDEWTYTDWEITDSTLVDSLEWWTYEYSMEYVLSYEDTCCYEPKINDVPVPCEWWLVDDCCGPAYWVDNVLHIPCCDEVDKNGDGLYDHTDYDFITQNDKYLQGEIDTLKAVSDSAKLTQGSWDDLRVPMNATRAPTLNYPGFDQVYQDVGETSTGVYLYCFDDGTEESLFFAVQMPYNWFYLSDATIYPHVHWIQQTDDTTNVVWGLEYTWARISDGSGESNMSFGSTTIIYSGEHPVGGANGSDLHLMSNFPGIDGNGYTFSSMLICRIFRAVDEAEDEYPADACMLEVDFHYKVRPGARGTSSVYTDD